MSEATKPVDLKRLHDISEKYMRKCVLEMHDDSVLIL